LIYEDTQGRVHHSLKGNTLKSYPQSLYKPMAHCPSDGPPAPPIPTSRSPATGGPPSTTNIVPSHSRSFPLKSALCQCAPAGRVTGPLCSPHFRRYPLPAHKGWHVGFDRNLASATGTLRVRSSPLFLCPTCGASCCLMGGGWAWGVGVS